MSGYPRGSEWHKWDLQVHTPFSYLNNQFGSNFDEYVKELFRRAIENDIVAIGITDYFCIEGYKKIKTDYLDEPDKMSKLFSAEEITKIQDITLFPNIELRLDNLVGSNRINFHVIFSNDVSIQDIEESFLHEIDFSYEGNPDDEDENWKLKIPNLEALGKKLKEDHANFRDQTDLFTGMMCAVVKSGQITKTLKEKKSKFQGKYILCLPADEDLSRVSWDEQDHLVRKNLVQKSSVIVSSNKNTIEWGLGKKHESTDAYCQEFKSLKPCIWGSDAHDYEKMFKPDKDRHTWIRAYRTFEGLQQIVYEPETRIYVGDTPPSPSPNSIENFRLNFSKDAKIVIEQDGVEDKEDVFCLQNTNATMQLSPFFNCFIGGRGSGKSTILNLFGIHSVNPESSEKFWKNKIRPLNFDPNSEDAFSTDGTEYYEFIGQSEVERFATDTKAFTNSVFQRMDAKSGGKLQQLEVEANLELKKFDQIADHLREVKRTEKSLKQAEREQKTIEKSLDVVSGKKYEEVTMLITAAAKSLSALRSGKKKVKDLEDDLAELHEKHFLDPTETEADTLSKKKNQYEVAFVSANEKLTEILESLNVSNFEELIQSETELETELENLRKKLKKILTDEKLTEENIAQVQSAPQDLEEKKQQILEIKDRLTELEQSLDKLNGAFDTTKTNKTDYEKLINESIKPLAKTLSEEARASEDIKEIGLRYSFNNVEAWENIANEFYDAFRSEFSDGERRSEVSDFIFENRKVFLGSKNEILNILQSKKQKYVLFLGKVLNEPQVYDVFTAIRAKHLADVMTYKTIEAVYDGKTIDNVSFGQRCTAVLIILMIFGNYPLIIDEPEAHLDSSLIANYLVPLIKNHKGNRQLIFATHNANFVVNGDAEKIFILSNEYGKTKVVETAIEDMVNRKELLKLEGGKKAFEKRGEKFRIKYK
ncbi:MAG: TrlF family AAA-like ATPase [Patescibacteria group bacterium]|mgnify:FL=1